jgi:hypothetical protein
MLKMVSVWRWSQSLEFLSEHVYTCFSTHYYFEHQGKRLNDYTELSELNLVEEPKIYMRPGKRINLNKYIEKYDEKERSCTYQTCERHSQYSITFIIYTCCSNCCC